MPPIGENPGKEVEPGQGFLVCLIQIVFAYLLEIRVSSSSSSFKHLPWSPRFFLKIFFAKERELRSDDNESRNGKKREKFLVTLASYLTSMQTTAVKRVKLLRITKVTNGNLANTCFTAAIFLSWGEVGPGFLSKIGLHG